MADWKIRNNYNTMIIGPITPDELETYDEYLYLIDEDLCQIAYTAINNGIRLLAHLQVDDGSLYLLNSFAYGYSIFNKELSEYWIYFVDPASGLEFRLDTKAPE